MTGSDYLRSLDPEHRPVVREWQKMPEDEFRARMAVALMDIHERLERKPFLRGAPQAIGGFLGGLLTVFLGTKGINQ